MAQVDSGESSPARFFKQTLVCRFGGQQPIVLNCYYSNSASAITNCQCLSYKPSYRVHLWQVNSYHQNMAVASASEHVFKLLMNTYTFCQASTSTLPAHLAFSSLHDGSHKYSNPLFVSGNFDINMPRNTFTIYTYKLYRNLHNFTVHTSAFNRL